MLHLLYVFRQYCLIPSDHQLLHVLVFLDSLFTCPVCDSSEVCGVQLKRLLSPPTKECFNFCFLSFYLKYMLLAISSSFKACCSFIMIIISLWVLIPGRTGFSTCQCCVIPGCSCRGSCALAPARKALNLLKERILLRMQQQCIFAWYLDEEKR